MNILYISSVCAQSRFDRCVNKGLINGQFQNQKFHHLLLKGLSESKDLDIIVVSFYPINRNQKINCQYEEEEENGVHYVYPQYTNRPIIHHVEKFLRTYQFLKKNRQSDSVIVCNVMNFDECAAALTYRIFHNIKICAITADVPGLTSGAQKKVGAWWKRMIWSMTYPFYKTMSTHYNAYFLLSYAMNDVINPKKKPYIVVEGLSDLSIQNINNIVEEKYPMKTMMYAGGLHREYGIELLIEAFRKLDDDNFELHVFGKGNYEKELIRITEEDHRIKYFGTKPNFEVVNAQLKAHVLVNPRPTNAEFVKYSFPSKVIECMSSGTPLLTTHIPSMPDEYLPFVYLIDDESVNGFFNAIRNVLSLPNNILEKKGYEAKSFILKKKNYMVQSKKFYNFLQDIV